MESELFIGIGCLVMVLLGMVIALFTILQKRNIHILEKAQQLAIFKAAAEAQDIQKAQISGNMHDQIMPLLTLLSLNIKSYMAKRPAGNYNNKNLEASLEVIQSISTQIREIAQDLMPTELFAFGLVESIEMFVEQLNNIDHSTAEFHNEADNAVFLSFSEEKQLCIYRICLEILNNIRKHVHYTYLSVTLEKNTKAFVLAFSHDGKGILNEEIEALRLAKKGLGLRSLQSRLLMIDGNLDYQYDGEVAVIKLSVPV